MDPSQVPQLAQPVPQDPNTAHDNIGAYPINSYDNHAVHILYHNRYRKTQAFEEAPPEAKAIFEQHVQQHQIAMQAGQTPQGLSDGAYEGYNTTNANTPPPAGGQPNSGQAPPVGGLMGPLGMQGQL